MIEINKTYKYQSLSDIQPVDVIVIQIRKNIRVEVSRDLNDKTNPFWIDDNQLIENK